MKKISFIWEAIVVFIIIWVTNIIIFPGNPAFLTLSPHPYLYIILLFAARYGFLKGLPALFLALGSFLGVLFARDFIYADLIPLGSFVIFHSITGMITDGFNSKLAKAESHIESLTRVSEDMAREKQKIEIRNEDLSQRLLSERSTFAILYKAARKLSTLEREKIYPAILELLDETLDTRKGAVFLLEGHTLVLKISSVKEDIPPNLMDQEILERVIREKKTFSIKDILDTEKGGIDEVFLCGPLLAGSGGEPVGIIVIWGLDFLKYNPTTVRLFSLLCDWASICLENAMLYEEGVLPPETKEFHGIFPYGTGFREMEELVNKL